MFFFANAINLLIYTSHIDQILYKESFGVKNSTNNYVRLINKPLYEKLIYFSFERKNQDMYMYIMW